jgi:hypothetical protein
MSMLVMLPDRQAETRVHARRPTQFETERERRLDAALADTFPASDPVAPGRFD